MSVSLPQGRYLSASGVVRADTGGQTRAMLMRSRIIGAATGSPVDILSFDPSQRYPSIRQSLYDSGQLTPDMRLLNLYEHYRQNGWGREAGTGRTLPEVTGLRRKDVTHTDGSVWETAYHDESGRVVLKDFRRADGSVYLRSAPYRTTREEGLPRNLLRVSPDSEVLGEFDGLPEFYHRWVRELTADDERAFLFIDSRFLAPLLAPIDDPTVHLIYVLHNCHLAKPRTWDSPPLWDYRRVLDSIQDLDAFVTLTQRQAEDIQKQWGPRPNIFVVSNPVEPPRVPEPLPPRDPRQVVIVARLEHQKRIGQAVAVMRRVLRSVPDARLDIYGSGSQQEALQRLIDRRALGDSVHLHGHHPRARDTLWTASAFLLTSAMEGYPLATLESLSRGCPVVSYDIPYGPRDQITDGVDGFLVPDDDVKAAAARVVRLLSSPELVAQMSEAGRRTASRHGRDTFLADWAAVLEAVLQQSPHRTRLRSADTSIRVFGARTRWRRRDRNRLQIEGRLTVEADRGDADPESATLQLVAADPATGAVAAAPIAVQQHDLTFHFTALLDPDALLAELPGAEAAYLQVRFAWQNSYWAASLTTEHLVPGTAVPSFADGRLQLAGSVPTPLIATIRRRQGDLRHRAVSLAKKARSAVVSMSRT